MRGRSCPPTWQQQHHHDNGRLIMKLKPNGAPSVNNWCVCELSFQLFTTIDLVSSSYLAFKAFKEKRYPTKEPIVEIK